MVEVYNPVLVVYDSLTRFHSQEENSNTDMKPVMMGFRSIANMGPMVWIIHHVAKESKSTRGAAEIVNAVDMEFKSTKRKDGTIKLGFGKVRIEEPPEVDLIPIFAPGGYNVVVQAAKKGYLTEQVDYILESTNKPVSVSDIVSNLRDRGLSEEELDEKTVWNILKARVSAGLVKEENLPRTKVDKNGRSVTRKMIHYCLKRG